jgi:nucleotide-binding universal stress UspA family protein
MSAKILIPVNGSASAKHAVDSVLRYRDKFSLPVTLLHVVDIDKLAYRMIPDFQVEMIRERAREAGEILLHQIAEQFSITGVEAVARIELGSPREVICRVANDEKFDLVIIGRHGIGEVRDVLFGSVANHVMHKVTCPVLLI